MTNETKERISVYFRVLPSMKERVVVAGLMLLIATTIMVTATYAWVTLSQAPEVSKISTTMSANGALEIALSKEDGTQPDEFDIDESQEVKTDNVLVSNLQWGNLVNLSDPAYGISNLALRPARLNTSALLTNPLWGAVYGSDGRVTNLDTNYAYVKNNNGALMVSDNSYGVRAIASYKAEIADSTQQAYNEKLEDVRTAHQRVLDAYKGVPGKFAPLGDMISKYAQDKLDNKTPGTNLAPYLDKVVECYEALYNAMEAQKDAYVALANFQYYIYAQNNSKDFVPVTWENLEAGKAEFNADTPDKASSNGIISLVGLTQFITDLKTMEADIGYLKNYYNDYRSNSTPYYWSSGAPKGSPNINVMIAHLIDHNSMTIDLDDDGKERKVTSLGENDALSLLGANGKSRKSYIYNGVMARFEQSAIDESYRLNGNAACTIRVSYVITITVYGKAYTKASGSCYFMRNYAAAVGNSNLAPNDAVAQDTYGLVIDLWTRTNAEQTCLTLEGATTTAEDGTIMSYDGVNRIWGSTGETALTKASTTQGGGSCYIYYADTPEDMMRSLSLLDAMKVAFVDEHGELLARASMDTVNYYAVNGRITVPLVLDSDSKTTYEYTDELNQQLVGRAITTLYTDLPVRIETIVYLDGDVLTNEDVLSAANIEGQLNLQFGSSVDLDTVGSNDLIDDTRSVTASVTKNEMNYDTAVAETDDLKTDVTVNVQGTQPSSVTAFFVRAINSTQGSREATMNFTKSENGVWTSSYKFTAPGVYYLRHVRLDGVDYALAEPCVVTVSGFSLKSLIWSETTNEVKIRTSDSTYSVTVTAEFASNDNAKLPKSVQARFVRTDGNTVNIPLTNSSGKWSGTGTFTTSGTYRLEYLVLDGKYQDLASQKLAKTLDLALGMYVSVTDLSGTLTEQFESGKSYSKNVSVKIFDNSDKTLEGLEGVRLYYSNGGSATSTINTNLTWDERNGVYTGTLPIVQAGRYTFSNVQLSGSSLTRCTESPVYTIISPDPPTFDLNSACTYFGENIQFVPLTNDAVIDGIVIHNAASANAAAVVYNSENEGSYYNAEMTYLGDDKWTVKLPTYPVKTGEKDANGEDIYEQSQEGTWSLVAIKLWNCYDESSNFRSEANPILWTGTDNLANTYVEQYLNGVTADDSYDFAKLSTTVSGKVNVTMTPGTTALGGSTTPFGTPFATNALGMNVRLTDGQGRVIPANKVMDVTLNVKYIQPTDASYGYKVNKGGEDYAIQLNTQDANGMRTVNSTDVWRYVGEYQVQSLTVTVGAKQLTFTSGSAGVPQKYTLRTAAPTVDNVKIENLNAGKTELGRNAAGDVKGTFLQSYSLADTNLKITVQAADSTLMSGAVMDGVTATLKLTYIDGSKEKGGYTFAGDTGYQELSIPMKAGQNQDVYMADSTVLLAGKYSRSVEVTVGGKTQTENLSDLTVWSKKPDVTMTAVNPSGTVTVNKTAGIYTKDADTFNANNRILNDGYSALVFASYKPFTKTENVGHYNDYDDTNYSEEYAHYTMPTLTFTLKNAGSTCTSFTMVIPNNNGKNITFSKDGASGNAEIGKVTAGTDQRDGTYKTETTLGGVKEHPCKYTYTTETPNVIGTQTIRTLSAVVGNVQYTMDLQTELSIVEQNSTPPSITFEPAEVDGFVTPSGKTSEDGRAFTFTLPASLKTASGNSYVESEEKIESSDTQTTGADPDETVKSYDIKAANRSWNDLKTGSTSKYYTLTGAAEKTDSHKVWGIPGDIYKKKWTLAVYEKTAYSQFTVQTVTVSGTTVETKTVETYSVKTQLDYWEVDGVRVQPGQTVTVSGNTIVRPVCKKDRTLLGKEVITTTVTGDVDYNYKAICNDVTKTVMVNSAVSWSGEYCDHITGFCKKTKGGKSAAEATSDGRPEVPSGYSEAQSGDIKNVGDYIRNYEGVKWERDGDPLEKSGTTTVRTQRYNANGELLLDEICDGDGKLIEKIK